MVNILEELPSTLRKLLRLLKNTKKRFVPVAMELQRPGRIFRHVSAFAILVAQLAAPAAGQMLPDVEIRAKVRAERVEIKQQGQAQIALRVDPGEIEPVRIERSAPSGQVRYRNLVIALEGKARIAAPGRIAPLPSVRETAGKPE